jgi:hypothetical protein
MTKFLVPLLFTTLLLSGCASSEESVSNDTVEIDSQSQNSTEVTEETKVDSEPESDEVEEIDTNPPPKTPQVTQSDFEAAIAAADTDYDEFDEETSFTVTPESAFADGTLFSMTLYLYSDGSTRTNFNTAYFDEDWLFFEFLDVRFQDETHEIYQAQSFDKYTEVVSGGYVQELFIHELSTTQVDLFEDLSSQGGAKLRLLGDGSSVEREFTPSELEGFKTIITIHRGLEQGLEYESGA